MGRQAKFIYITNKFIALKVANRLIAANTNPIWNLIASKKLTGPVSDALTD